MPATEAQRQWISDVLGVSLPASRSDPYASFAYPGDFASAEESEQVSKTLPDDLKKAIKSDLEEILKLQSVWETGIDDSNYGLFSKRVDEPSEDLEALYTDSSKLLKTLKGRKESEPALEEYMKYLDKDKLKTVKYRKNRYGAYKACQLAGTYIEQDRKERIEHLLEGEQEEDKIKILDELVKFPTEPEHLVEQARMRALIELRFGLKFSEESPLATGHQKGLDRLYEVLKDVPAKQLKLLQTFKGGIKLDYADEGFRGDYSETTQTVAIAMPLADHKQVQRPNSAGEPATVEWFKQVALHEVGHAVDDAAGYMDGHREAPDHGAWEVSDIHKTVGAYAAALQSRLGTDIKEINLGHVVFGLEKFIAFSILKFAISDENIKIEDPQKRKIAVDFSRAASGLGQKNKFWNKGLAAAEAAAECLGGTRVHFEAYKDKWWSFDIAQRRKAVTDYQWRSPAEWFAEPYALYYQGKLDSGHPVAKYCAETAD